MKADIVVPAALITLGVVFALFVYAFMSKTDFTMMGGMLCVLGVILFIGSLIKIFYHSDTF